MRLNDYSLIEPESLVRHFVAHPPEGLSALIGEDGAPIFSMRFDLLTTADADTQRRVTALPFYRHWRHWLSPRTCFVGTTVSEYVPTPRNVKPAEFAERMLRDHGPHQRLLVIKDIPFHSPLISGSANRYADDLVDACRAQGCVVLTGQALAYVPIDFDSIDQYLGRLSPARRKDLKRKLRARADLKIDVVPTGSEPLKNPAEVNQLYELYLNVYRQSTVHFDLLTRNFFAAVLADDSSGGLLFRYHLGGRLIGFNLCFHHGDKLIDKYVGFRYPEARDTNLYFVSWFQNLEYALANRLRFYVAGWTDPEVKRNLGAHFTWTRHAVYARSRVLRALLRRFSGHFESDRVWHEDVGDGFIHHS